MVVSNFFCFRQTKTILGKIWFKKSKLSAEAEIWHLNNFEYADFNGDNVHFSCFRAEITFFGETGSKKLKLFKLSNASSAALI